MASASGIRAGKAWVEISTRDTALYKGLKRAEARLKAFGASVKQVGQSFMTLAKVAVTPFAASAVVFADYEQQMARVKALIQSTSDDVERDYGLLAKKAKEMGAATVFSAGQAAEAMGNFALAGFKTGEILKAVEPTLNLAAAGQIEIAEAADIASSVMRGMGGTADDLVGMMDILAKGMTTANTDIQGLGDAFKFVAPTARTAGFSVEEVTAAIQMLSDAGIKGEMAGTTLRGMLQSLTSPSKEAKDLLDKLGVSVADAKGNVRPLVQIIGQLESKISKMGSAQQLDILGTIFSARAGSGAAALVSEGAASLAQRTAALQDSVGTSAGIAATQLDTLTGSAKILLSVLQGLAIEVAEAVTPAIREWIARLGNTINIITTVIKQNRGLVQSAFKITLIIVGVTAALFAVGVALTAAGVGFGWLAGVIALVVSPIGAVITILGAAGYALVRFTGTGRQAFESLKSSATMAMGGIADALKAGDIALAGKILWLSLRIEFQKGINFLNKIWQDWSVAFRDVFAGVSLDLTAAWIDLWAKIQKVITQAGFYMLSVWDDVMSGFQIAWIKFVGLLSAGLAAVKKLFSTVFVTLGIYRAGEAFKEVEEEVADRIEKLREQANERRQGRADQAQDTFNRLDSERRSGLQAVEDQREADREARFQAARDSVASGDARLDALKQELAEAIEQAKPKAVIEELEGDPASGGPSGLRNITPDGLDSTLDKSEAKTDVKGAFSAAALRSLGTGDGVNEEQLSELKKQTDAISKLKDYARQGRLVFEA